MMRPLIPALCAALLAVRALAAECLLDRVDEALTFTAFNDAVRARVSGLADLEGYGYTRAAIWCPSDGSDNNKALPPGYGHELVSPCAVGLARSLEGFG